MQIIPNRPAFLTVAWDLAGKVDIQQIQRRDVLEKDDGTLQEIALHPIELLHVANPTPQDVMGDLTAALGEVNGALVATVAQLQADLAAANERADRLQILVDAFPQADPESVPASAAEPADVVVTETPPPGSTITGDTVTIVS